jgi:hypothetical protein
MKRDFNCKNKQPLNQNFNVNIGYTLKKHYLVNETKIFYHNCFFFILYFLFVTIKLFQNNYFFLNRNITEFYLIANLGLIVLV